MDAPEQSGPLHRKVHVHQLDLLFRQLDSLPALPAAAARLLSLAGQGPPARDELVAAIRMDQSVSARLLSLARRKWPGRAIQSIEAAAEALGADGVRSAVLGMKVFAAFAPAPGGLELRGFWKHCVAVAAVSEAAARRRPGRADPSSAFLCGLLHDIGKLALGHCLPKSYQRALEAAGNEQCAVLRAERRLIGTDHTIVGRRLARHWLLPTRIQEVIWLHHQPLEAIPSVLGGAAALAGLIQLADAIACERGFGFGGSRAVVTGSAELARQMGFSQDDLAALTADVPRRLEQLADLATPGKAAAAVSYPSAVAETAAQLADCNERLAARAAGLARQVGVLNSLRDFARRITPTATVPELCGEIARTFSHLGGGERQEGPGVCAFAVAGDEAHVIIALPGRAGEEAFRFTPCGPVPAAPSGRCCPAGPLLRKLLLRPDAWSDLIEVDLYTCLPLVAKGRCVGGILLPGREPPSGLDPDELAPLLEFLGFVLAAAVGRANAEVLAEQLAQASQRLAETRQELAEAEALAAVGEMAAGAAHEINNPLAVIAGRAQMLAEHVRTRKDRQSAELIAEKAEQISDIATELMSFARPDPPEPAEVAVQELLAGVSGKVKDQLVQKTHSPTVDMEIQPGCPRLWVDAGQIEQVLLELIRNAATAGGGAADVRIEASCPPGSPRVAIRVSDNGPGMDEATRAAAFTPFYSNRPAGRGRGMGLARAKRTVQANGGRIWIESQPNKGTTVSVELPRSGDPPSGQ